VTVTGGTGMVTLQADNDVIGDANGKISTENGDVAITGDLDGSNFPGTNANGTIQTSGDITAGSGTVTFRLADCDGWLGAAATTGDGEIVSAGDVIKNGSGALRLNGTTNTITGTATVNAGHLLVNGTLDGSGTGQVVAACGGTLGGNGTIQNMTTPAVLVQDGGTLDPGDVSMAGCAALPGRLTVDGYVTFEEDSTFRVQLNSREAGVDADGPYGPNGYDQLLVDNGDVYLSGDSWGANGSLLDLSVGFAMPIGAMFVLIDNDGGNNIDSRFEGHPEGDFFTCDGYPMSISYYSGEDGDHQDVAMAQSGRFDFNGYSENTAPNYRGVPANQVKSESNDYGWDAPIDSFVRPENYPAPHPTADPLLMDGHFVQLTTQRTFQVDVAPEQTYQVSILTGDWVHPRDWQQFRVYDGGETGSDVTKIVSTQADVTEYTTVRFEVYVGASGRLCIEMQDRSELATPGDETNPATVILGMDLRPAAAAGSMTITRTDPPEGSPVDLPLPADGLTIDTYRGTGAPPNALLTVRASNGNEYLVNDVTASNLGAITTTDQDMYHTYTQVYAAADGSFTFQLQRPTGIGPVYVTVETTPGTHIVPSPAKTSPLAEDAFEASRGTYTQTYTLPDTRLLDFNAGNEVTATNYGGDPLADYVGVPVTQTYDDTTTNALGWNPAAAPLTSFDRGISDALLRDGHYGYDSEFWVDLPTGTYIVNTVIGDTAPFYHDQVQVSAEKDTSRVRTVMVSTTAGQWTSSSFVATIDDGRLNLVLKDMGGVDPHWVLNALRVRPAPTLITITPPGGALDANGSSVDTFEGSGAPAGSWVTVATTLGTIATADASATYQGVQVLADGDGNFRFEIQRPSGTGGSGNVTATVTAQEVFGRNLGSTAQEYQPPQTAATVLRFDFGASSLYTQAALPGEAPFTYVGPRDIFSATRGYGWSTRVAAADRPWAAANNGFSNLNRDLHTGSTATFRVQVGAGSYKVRVYLANPLGSGGYQYTYDNFEVRVEGGSTYAVTSLTPGFVDVQDLVGSTEDNILDILFIDLGGQNFNWVVSGIEIVEASGTLPTAINPLLAVETALGGGAQVSDAALTPLVAEASARWAAAGLTPAQSAVLSDLHIGVADLGGAYLGLAYPTTNEIRLDDDAAGWGWYLDPRPGDDVEFFASPEHGTPSPVAGVDLLTVLMHEIGHLLGYEHSEGGLMAPVMSAGTRRLASSGSAEAVEPLGQAEWRMGTSSLIPASARVDGVFADLGRDSSDDGILQLLSSENAELIAAATVKSGQERSQARVPRRSRMQRIERELDAWFAEWATHGDEVVAKGRQMHLAHVADHAFPDHLDRAHTLAVIELAAAPVRC